MDIQSAVNGNLDIIKDKISVTFPATISTADVSVPVIIPLINDDTVEAEEGFYLVITVNTSLGNSTDICKVNVLRNGVALIRIKDSDGKAFSVIIVCCMVLFCSSTS